MCATETAVNFSSPKLVILHMNMALHVYEDIMRMTENLSEKYIIGYRASSTVYKSFEDSIKYFKSFVVSVVLGRG